jgi:hypothetical protein
MATKPKIKITDNHDLRSEIDKEYESADQINLARWAIICARHVLPFAKDENVDFSVIENGFGINELWQNGKATVGDVRQVGFKIHSLARKCKTEVGKNAIRTAGQAVGVGHMKEHAMVCSDYAIKTIELAFPREMDKASKEREWQLYELKKLKTSPQHS